MSTDFEIEIKREFLTECEELVADAESAFLRLEHERENEELINEIFRLAHNLKGSSRAVGFEQMADLTHAAETFVLKIKEKTIEINDGVINALLNFKDLVSEMCTALKADPDATFDISEAQESFTQDYSGGGAPPEAAEAEPQLEEEPVATDDAAASEAMPEAPIQSIEDELREAVEANAAFDAPMTDESGDDDDAAPSVPAADAFGDDAFGVDASEASGQEVEKVAVSEDSAAEATPVDATPEVSQAESAPAPQKQEAKPAKLEAPPTPAAKKNPSQGGAQKAGPAAEEETIRVNLSRIDKLNNMIGELVIIQTILNQRKDQYIEDELSVKSIVQMNKIFKEAQELSLSLRMMPLKPTFQKMSRIIRDAAKALDKNARLELYGEKTEVDKTILQFIADPLVHLVRNAVDHGLETKEERAKTSKDQTGTIKLAAKHEGNNLVIEINDDGKGIDPNVIRAKAIEKGVIKESDNLSDSQVIHLIFHAGFSTAAVVSDISGRGVGMDVVRTNIEKLGGKVHVESEVGLGTSLKITLPLTLAIIDGLIVTCSSEQFVVPLSQVFELTNLTEDRIEEFTRTATLFQLRDEVIPVFDLHSKITNKKSTPESLNDCSVVIVVRGLGKPFGVAVQDIVAQQQVVIKKLGSDISNQQGLMGSAIMGDGKPIVIVDLFETFRSDLSQPVGGKMGAHA